MPIPNAKRKDMATHGTLCPTPTIYHGDLEVIDLVLVSDAVERSRKHRGIRFSEGQSENNPFDDGDEEDPRCGEEAACQSTRDEYLKHDERDDGELPMFHPFSDHLGWFHHLAFDLPPELGNDSNRGHEHDVPDQASSNVRVSDEDISAEVTRGRIPVGRGPKRPELEQASGDRPESDEQPVFEDRSLGCPMPATQIERKLSHHWSPVYEFPRRCGGRAIPTRHAIAVSDRAELAVSPRGTG